MMLYYILFLYFILYCIISIILYSVSGINLEQMDVDSVIQNLVEVIGVGYGDGVTRYDAFICHTDVNRCV